MNNLAGKSLRVLSVHRSSLLDAQFVCGCENCGRAIVNVAEVQDENGKVYNIGLDCKKTLIDKKVIDKILIENDSFDAKYKVKEYKAITSEIEKFLKLCAYPDVEIVIDPYNSIMIYDNLPHKDFPGYTGNTIYIQNVNYLKANGLKNFIQELINKGKITFSRN